MPRTPPRTPKTDFSRVTNGNAVQERLRARYGALQDWKAVGAEIGVSGGTAYRVAMSSYEPKDNAIRERLGLPALGTAELCPVHGKVCAVKHRKPTAPRRKRPNRLVLWLWAAWLGRNRLTRG